MARRGTIRPLSEKESKRVYNSCLKNLTRRKRQKNSLHYIRASVEVIVAMFSGLRVAEISALMWADISQDTRTDHKEAFYIHVRHGKGGKARHVQIGIEARDILYKWRQLLVRYGYSAEPSDCIFFGFRGRGQKQLTTRRIQQDCERVLDDNRVSGHSIHDLRHTYATYLYVLSKDVSIVQNQLGHDDIKTTLRYISVAGKFINKILNSLYK